jgi:hypothetical protein
VDRRLALRHAQVMSARHRAVQPERKEHVSKRARAPQRAGRGTGRRGETAKGPSTLLCANRRPGAHSSAACAARTSANSTQQKRPLMRTAVTSPGASRGVRRA